MSEVPQRSATHYWFMTLSLRTLTSEIGYSFVLPVLEETFRFSSESNWKGNVVRRCNFVRFTTVLFLQPTQPAMPVGLAPWLHNQWHYVGFSCTELQSHFTGSSQTQVCTASFHLDILLLVVVLCSIEILVSKEIMEMYRSLKTQV